MAVVASSNIAVKKEDKEILSIKETRLKYKAWKSTLPLIFGMWAVLSLFYVPLFPLLIYFLVLSYVMNIYRLFFADKEVKALYERYLQPKMQRQHFFDIGIMIYPEDVMQVISDVNKGIYKQDEYARQRPYDIVGISKNSLTTHYWILGTTGAGKTALLMKMFQEHIKNGGGLIFCDGKSDSKMFAQLYSIAKEAGRETDVYLVNFLKPEEKSDTNTYNPIASLEPQQATEFLSSLMNDAGGDASYWQGRGIVLLRPILYFLGFRKKFYKEAYSYETVKTYLSFREFSFLSMLSTAMTIEYDRKLKEDTRISEFIQEAMKMKPGGGEFEAIEFLDTYFKQKPQDIAKFTFLGYDIKYLEMLYQVYKLAIHQYVADISAGWKEGINVVADAFLEYVNSQGKELISLGIKDILLLFKDFQDSDYIRIYANKKANNNRKKAEEILRKAEMYERIEPEELQQMQYGQQQWTNIFSSLEVFSHIFGALEPDVDFNEVIRNNKILYILLPPLEQSKNTTEILGKMIVTSIKQTASIALGGNVEVTRTQDAILKSQISPKPLMVVTLDEYGAYPVDGIDTILAQVRSINISTLIATQDYTSGRVGGSDENSVRRLWANSQKIILRIKDDEVIKKVEELTPEIRVQRFRKKDLGYEQEKELDMEYDREKMINLSVLQANRDGLGIIITDDYPVIFHAFWANARPANDIVLTRFENV